MTQHGADAAWAETERLTRQSRRVADAITRDFPLQQGGVLLFAGTGSNRHVAEIGWRVSQQLASQSTETTLLVDADAASRCLTEYFALAAEPGLAEVLQCGRQVAATAVATGQERLCLEPFGDGRLARNPIASDAVKELVSHLRQQYRYTILVGGTERSGLLAMLGRHSDGVYLVVQVGVARRPDTSALADYLTRAGARLLGCIATGSV